MGLIFTPTVTDNFTPNADPLNPAKWTTMTDASIYGAAEAHSGTFRAATATYNDGLTAGAFYTGATFTANQYLSFELSAWALGSSDEGDFYLRSSDLTGDLGYNFSIIDNGDGVTAEVIIGYYTTASNFITLYDNEAAIVGAGDVFTYGIVGYTSFLYHNGVLVAAVNDSNQTCASGYLGMVADPQNAAGEIAYSNFIAGTVSGGFGGPSTNGVIFPGSYGGSSLAAAFPNAQGLDFFQVSNEGGDIVWNLNSAGIATANPTNPTNGTLLGVFSGTSFANAFQNNPQQLNVFQIIMQGGQVVFHVDYQGNATI
jgi:hypothetical protein